ncbi:MAG: riboflavin biosynthesis protein RibF, partial [Saprospiraceae bacterium]|nr:riboflavin biosynthesis protein RibF [Saprospiraceae bacterium]
VHLGHTSIIEKMQELAAELNGETILVTFDPHPRKVIYPHDTSLRLLSTKAEKIRLFEKTGIDHLVFFPFSIEFSQWDPNEYIENFIIEKFHPKCVVIGYDHRFGLNRSGNVDFLRSYEKRGGFTVFELPQKVTEELEISSTRIRSFIADGDISRANQLLGHPYLISGEVVPGEQIGEKLGYPTANILIDESLKLIPPVGVYAARVVHNNKRYGGMMYIGTRPTVSKKGKLSIEINIFEFNDDIYSEKLTIEVLKFLRSDQVFETLDELREQLDHDKVETQAYLRTAINSFAEATILILNYNGRKHLETYLPSVVRFNGGYQVVVADNGSTDDSIAFLSSNYPEIRIIQLNDNHGFAGGYNRAIKLLNSDFIILLNSDAEVTNLWANKLIDFLSSRPDIGAIQPKVKSALEKNLFEYAGAGGGLLDKFGYPFCQGRILSEVEQDLGQYDRPKEIFWATGASMVIRKKIFEKCGGFDEDFFAHMEEIDLCWRLKQFGYQIWVLPSSVVYHLGGGTLSYQSPRKTYLNFRNGMSLLLKNEKGMTLLWLFPTRMILDLVAGLRFLLVGEFDNAKAVLNAIGYVIINFGRIWKKRSHILANKKRLKIGNDNSKTGRYRGSIVWEFFIMGRKKYHDLRYVAKRIS